MSIDADTEAAMALIHNARTMVLATCRDHEPWSAPVYYIYARQGLYFFSSPRSLHIRASQNRAAVSAAVYADSADWKRIEGVQMAGHVRHSLGTRERVSVTGRYLLKFPLARELLEATGKQRLNLKERVQLYCFLPDQIHYLNNQTGFGQRVSIAPPKPEPKES